MGAEAAIRCEGLTKYYGGRRGLVDADLTVGAGEVFGFLGPNGAGKTTLIRLLLDLIRPTRGRATVLGLDAQADALAVQARVGYLPGELRLDGRLTGRQLLEWYANLRGGVAPARRDELCERLGLDPTRRIRDLSQGNKQKVGLVQALQHDPEVAILDEPSAGLDPLVQQEFLVLLREAAGAGRTVFLSSHILAEVEQAADRAAIVRDGRIVATEDIGALTRKAVRRFRVTFGEPVAADAARDLAALPELSEVAGDGAVLTAVVEGSPDAMVKRLAGYHVIDLVAEAGDLSELFFAHYRDDAASRKAG